MSWGLAWPAPCPASKHIGRLQISLHPFNTKKKIEGCKRPKQIQKRPWHNSSLCLGSSLLTVAQSKHGNRLKDDRHAAAAQHGDVMVMVVVGLMVVVAMMMVAIIATLLLLSMVILMVKVVVVVVEVMVVM
eukprot:scaffold38370_cov19-Tisochrysis_lutea.AAC.1